MFQQPLDTLELIFLYVDEPKDLLSIALTCKSLNDLVIPHHIQFRHIRCDYRRLNLWKALAVRPGYGARVRKIEIIQETGNTANVKPVLVPWDFYHTLDPEEPSQRTIDTCIASLAEAVAHMTRLQGFAMTRQVPFSSEFGQVYGKLKDNCTQLRELQVDIQKTQSLSLPNEAQRIFNNVHLPVRFFFILSGASYLFHTALGIIAHNSSVSRHFRYHAKRHARFPCQSLSITGRSPYIQWPWWTCTRSLQDSLGRKLATSASSLLGRSNLTVL